MAHVVGYDIGSAAQHPARSQMGRGALKTLAAPLLLCGLALGGCAVTEAGINPKTSEFYFPVGITLDADRSVLYVANSNADLRYNGGTLMALDLRKLPVDLSRVGAAVQAKKVDCAPDRIDRTRWECKVGQFVMPEAVLRIGNFPNGVALAPDGKRLFLPIRGEDPQDYLLWVDVADLGGGKVDLRCDGSCDGSGDCTAFDCDSDHRVSFSRRLGRDLPEQPFAVLVDRQLAGDNAGEDWVFVTHLSGGEVSFLRSTPTPGGPVVLSDYRGGFFDSTSSVVGAFALAATTPGDATNNPIYVSSRSNNVIASFVIRDGQSIVRGQRVPMRGASPGGDVRGIGLSPDGKTLYAVSRDPSSLVALDLSKKKGQARNEAKWTVEVCSEPSVLALTPKPGSADPNAQLAYVVCFGEGAVFVVDTELSRLEARIETGAGPNQLVIDSPRKRAFIANFVENTIGVIDLDPTRATYNRMVLRIGERQNLIQN
ncbi:MAG: hypothetical protein CSA65_03065 [Proteobacteria bacterium]|nr:MAG: hypothetical protein CSB49_07660 [Pseudomonadota bacterium]PIE19189.1 MAG: hypothetical protein CSA65_03065 [Pseudomonadota bacterium]